MTLWHIVPLGHQSRCLSWVNKTSSDIQWSSLLLVSVQIYSSCGQEGSSLCFVTKRPLLFQAPCIFKPSPVNSQPSTVNHHLYTKPCKVDLINSCGERDAMVIGRKLGSLQDKVLCLPPCISNVSVAVVFKHSHSCCISQKIRLRFILVSWFLCQIQYLIKWEYYR